jgi:type I restriction enzyme S subunit
MSGSWKYYELGSYCSIVNGSTPKTGIDDYWNGNIVWVTPTDLSKNKYKYICGSERKITDAGYKSANTTIIERNNIILSTRAPIGYIAINNVEACTNQGCKSIMPCNELNVDFLYYYLKFKKEKLDELGSGTTFKELSTNSLMSFKIPVPSIVEQKRIVKIIETKLTAVEKMKMANDEQLYLLYQLFNIYLKEIFEENHEKVLLSNLTLPIENITSKYKGFIEYIDISSIDNINKKITATQNISINDAPSRAKQITISNDILVSTVRPNLNAVAINNIESKNIIVCSTGYCVLRCNEKIQYKYLFYYCLSKYFIEYLTCLAKGSSYPAVVNDDVLSCYIPLPSIEKQNEIIKYLDSKYRLLRQLISSFTEQSTYINALSSSILRKAFNGDY